MRVEFLAAVDGGYANPGAMEVFLAHMERARSLPGGEAGAVREGHLVWIDPRTGVTLQQHRRGAIAWPSSPSWGSWWVDHIVELQHGGADDPANYMPLTNVLHGLKTQMMRRWTRQFAATLAEARKQREDIPVGVP